MDTTGPACSLALRAPGRDDVCVSEPMGRGQAERLAPMVQQILEESGQQPGDLDRIGVTTGPGSFAGTRIGIAFARGLSLATGAECVGLGNLEWAATSLGASEAYKLLIVHDARRGDVVSQLFDKGTPLGPPVTRSVEETNSWIRDTLQSEGGTSLRAAGSGATLLEAVELVTPARAPDLSVLLDLAAAVQPPFEKPKPFYARPPDAKLPG